MIRYSVTAAAISQIRQVGGENIKILRNTGVMFADLTDEQVSLLKSQGCTVEEVKKLTPNITISQPRVGSQLYSAQQLTEMAGFGAFINSTNPPLYGSGVNVAVIDTGILPTHQQIRGRVIHSMNYTPDVDGDLFNHGTGVASIILSVAPMCGILDMKVMNSEGRTTTEEVIEAIEDCIELWHTNPQIAPVAINLSIGAEDPGNPNDPLRVACRAALQNRIWVSAAAGNLGPESMTIVTPACERYVIATGSVNPITLEPSDFSSRGPTIEGLPKPDVVFFGENIRVASSESDNATIGKSGTSFSAPFTTGISLLMLEGVARNGGVRQIQSTVADGLVDIESQISVEQLIDGYLLNVCAKPNDNFVGKDDTYGYGLPIGDLIAQSITGMQTTASPLNLVSAIMAMGVIGIMSKVIK